MEDVTRWLGIGLLGALLASSAARAQDDPFGDLARSAASRPAKVDGSASSVVKLGDDDNDILLLLASAINDMQLALQGKVRDAKGHLPADSGYTAYETRKDSAGHLMLAGSLFHNSFEGFSGKNNPEHAFSIVSSDAAELARPLRYVRGSLRHASEPVRRLVGVLGMILDALCKTVVKGPEARWFELPPRAAGAARLAAAELAELAEFVNVVDMYREYAEPPGGMLEKLRQTLEFNRDAFGIGASGDTVDEARAASAFTRTTKGLPPWIASGQQSFALKSDVGRKLNETLGQPVIPEDGPTVQERIRSMAATIGKELTAGLTVPSGFWFDSRARSEQAALVLQTQARLQALTNVLAWLQVRTKGQR